MGMLKNTQHERFAKSKARGKSAVDSYKQAISPTPNDATAFSNAYKVDNRPEVKERVEEILERKGMTKEWWLEEGQKISNMEINGQPVPSAKVGVWKEMGKVLKLTGPDVQLNMANIDINLDPEQLTDVLKLAGEYDKDQKSD